MLFLRSKKWFLRFWSFWLIFDARRSLNLLELFDLNFTQNQAKNSRGLMKRLYSFLSGQNPIIVGFGQNLRNLQNLFRIL